MHLVEEVTGVESISDCHPASRTGDGRPVAHVDGVVDVIATRTNVENTANAGLQLSKGRGFVPTPTVAALAGLGVESDGVPFLITHGSAEFAGPDRGFDDG